MANSEMDYIHGYMADQTYDPTSMNAQSGIAVAEAIGVIAKEIKIPTGSSTNVLIPNAGLLFIGQTTTDCTLWYLVGNTATKLLGTGSASITVNMSSYYLTVQNNIGWTISCLLLYLR